LPKQTLGLISRQTLSLEGGPLLLELSLRLLARVPLLPKLLLR
jgi:hypothetical protein